MMTKYGRWALAAALTTAVCAAPAARADAPAFPADGWAQGGPLQMEALKGKVVVLQFFEEGCPRCAGAWPGWLAEAEKYEGKPVVFVAVNSGNNAQTVSSYLRGRKCDWPALADTDRSYEAQMNVGTISLNNIWQTRVVTPGGEVVPVNGPGDAGRFVDQASWKIDPAEVPEKYKKIWEAYEFGQVKAVAAGMRRVRATDEAEKAFVDKLVASINADADAMLAQAKADREAGNVWAAYKAFDRVDDTFAGYDQAKEAAAAKRELAKDEQVKKETVAARALQKIRQMASSPVLSQRETAKAAAAELIERYPDTEAARLAQSLK